MTTSPAKPQKTTHNKQFFLKKLSFSLGILTLLCSFLTTALPAEATSTNTITGIAGKCFDDKWGSTTNGNPIQLYHCNNSNAQQWSIADDGTIHNQGKCLDVHWAGTKPETPIQLYDCNGTVAQQWVVNKDLTIVNPHSKLCLDDKWAGTDDSTPIWLYTCNGTISQHWTVVAPPPAPAAVVTPTPVVTPDPTPTPTPTPVQSTTAPTDCPNGTYTNSAGEIVCSPYAASSVPAGATAKCKDGAYSFSKTRSGSCSHHGGVAVWY